MRMLIGMTLVLALIAPAFAAEEDIVDTAVAAGQFKNLAAAPQAGRLVDTPKEEGPFTVLAPTDAAFAKLLGGRGSAQARGQGEANRDPDVPRPPGQGDGGRCGPAQWQVGQDCAGEPRPRSPWTAGRYGSTRPRSSRLTSAVPTAPST